MFYTDGDGGTPSHFVQVANPWYDIRDTYIVRFVVDGCRKNLPLCATSVMKTRLLIAFALILGMCVFAYPHARDALMQFDRAAQRAFDSLPMGITLDDAAARLGSDSIRDAPECCLPQRHAFESEFERAEASTAVHFYLYQNGVNWYYCLGFDADGLLVVTGQGSS